MFRGAGAAAGMATPLPFTPGYDVSGVIESISDDVTDFKVGDEVFGTRWGSRSHTDEFGQAAGGFAEFVIFPIRSIVKKPENLSHIQAAAMSMVTKTATGPLDKTEIGPNSKILILGGSSAVGSTAIQLAKLKGAWIATTCSTRALSYVSQFGADQIINYEEQNWYVVSHFVIMLLLCNIARTCTSFITTYNRWECGLPELDAIFETVRDVDTFEHAKLVVKEGKCHFKIRFFLVV